MRSIMQKFLRTNEGSVFIIVAFGMLALIGAMGAAVDIGRGQMMQTKLQNALDAAGLAAGASVNSADVNETVAKYLAVNFTQGTSQVTVSNINTQVSSDGLLITIDATATMPTTLMKVLGENTMDLSAHTEITRANKGMELALVLDTTGSMAGSKLTSLKQASNDLLDILYGSKTTQDDLWIGVVPFSQAVNVGTSHTDWLNTAQYTALNWGPTSWAGCVEARWQHGHDITDDPPSVETFDAYYWADNDDYNNWIKSDGTYKTITSELGPNRYCPVTVTRLSNLKSTVQDGIASLEARGNTHTSEGMAWGWRMLSPRWRGLWGGTMDANALPLDYNTDRMIKAVVLMTDGENTISDSVDGAYGYLSDGELGTTRSSTAVAALDDKFSSVCTAMKAKGVIVYTVVFNLSSSSVATLLRNCASQPDYYFNSPDGAALRQAFRTIGDSLANLRVSK